MYTEIKESLKTAARELIEAAGLKRGNIVAVGCSTSEVIGEKIGTSSVKELGEEIYKSLAAEFGKDGIYIAAQCCEHLNRAIIIEREAAPRAYVCNAVPQPKAGGSFATAAYANMKDPIAVESIVADAGMDIGDTLIGMHVRPVVVPCRIATKKIGEAHLVCARSRAKFIGGERAHYDDNLK